MIKKVIPLTEISEYEIDYISSNLSDCILQCSTSIAEDCCEFAFKEKGTPLADLTYRTVSEMILAVQSVIKSLDDCRNHMLDISKIDLSPECIFLQPGLTVLGMKAKLADDASGTAAFIYGSLNSYAFYGAAVYDLSEPSIADQAVVYESDYSIEDIVEGESDYSMPVTHLRKSDSRVAPDSDVAYATEKILLLIRSIRKNYRGKSTEYIDRLAEIVSLSCGHSFSPVVSRIELLLTEIARKSIV